MSAPNAPPTSRVILNRPWLLVLILLGVLFVLGSVVYWRSSSAAAQVQVPMFYDAHYLFPRPWTQEQSAPGVPDPAPVAIYGENKVSQSFIAGSDNLARVGFYLAADGDGPVHASLSGEDGKRWEGDIILSPQAADGRAEYAISFPPMKESKGKRYTLTLAAPQAAAEHPLIVHAVGGDRLGDSLHLNEFIRPGNLAINTYSRGAPGVWWFDAVAEQLLPSLFRLRLQQYKPPLFKGNVFSWLLVITLGLSAALLVLAAPGQQTRRASYWSRLAYTTGWFLVLLLSSFLIWQVGSGRMRFAAGSRDITAVSVSGTESQAIAGRPRLAADLISDLWTAVRRPEARLIHSDLVARYPAIIVPGDSRIEYAFIVPPDGRLRFAQSAQGSGILNFNIAINQETLFEQEMPAEDETSPDELSWQELDLDPWSGQGVVLALETDLRDGEARGLWFMPQISTDASWVRAEPPDDLLPINVRFAESVELLGVTLDDETLHTEAQLKVRLYWRPLQEIDRYGKIFVHLIDGAGQIVAQDDSPPLQGAYPFTIWQPGSVILDEHMLQVDPDLLTAGPYHLAIGVYDPDTLERWPAQNPDGTLSESGMAVLPLPEEVLP
ncbi:MAG: hypothetical protein ACK2UT_00110 [Candidatus Promineifilaceae bacterium]